MSQVVSVCMRPQNSTTNRANAAALALSHKGQTTTATVGSTKARAITPQQGQQQKQPQLLRLAAESATAVRTPTQHIKTLASGILAENKIPITVATATKITTSNTNTNNKPNPNRINLKNHQWKYQSDSYVSATTSTPSTTTATQSATAEILLISNAKTRICFIGAEADRMHEANFINLNSNGLMVDAKLVCDNQMICKCQQEQYWRPEGLKWPCAELEVGSITPTATVSVPATTKSHTPADRHCCCRSTLLACRNKRYKKSATNTTIAAATITTTTYLLDILRKLCLVFVLLLSILTLQHANCQQLMPLTAATANTIAATTTATASAAGSTTTATTVVLNALQTATATFTIATATNPAEAGVLLYKKQPQAQNQRNSNNTFTTTPPQAHAHMLPYPHPTKHGPGSTTYVNLQVKANDFIKKSTIKEISQQTSDEVDEGDGEEDEEDAENAAEADAEKYAEVEQQKQQLELFKNVVLAGVAAAEDGEVEPLLETGGHIIDIEQVQQLLEEEEDQHQPFYLRRKRQLSANNYPIPIPKPKSDSNYTNDNKESNSNKNNNYNANSNNHNSNKNAHSDNYAGNVINVVGHVADVDDTVSAQLWHHYDTTTQIVEFMQQQHASSDNNNKNAAANTNADDVATLLNNSKNSTADYAKNASNIAPKSRQNSKQTNATYTHSLIVFSNLIYNQTNSHNTHNNNVKVKNNHSNASNASSETRALHKPKTTKTVATEIDINFAKTASLRNSPNGADVADTAAMSSILQQFNQNLAQTSAAGNSNQRTQQPMVQHDERVYATAKTVASGSLQHVANVITNDNNSDNDVDDENVEPNSFTDYEDNRKLLRLVMDGLGLKKLPDMKKVNVSQQEYATKYREYLRRVHERKRRELAEVTRQFDGIDWDTANAPLHIVSIVTNSSELLQRPRRKRDMQSVSEANAEADSDDVALIATNFSQPNGRQRQRSGGNSSAARRRHNEKTRMVLHFPLNVDAAQLQPGDIEEANIRLMLIHSPALATKHNNRHKNKSKRRPCGGGGAKHTTSAGGARQKQVLNLKVYQRLQQGKRLWLDGRKLDIEVDQSRADDTHSQWLQFDVTSAVESWLRERHTNLGLEVQCDNCQRIGARILNDVSAPAEDTDDYDADDDYQLMPVLNIIGRLGVTYQEMRTRKHSNSVDAMAAAAHQHHHNVAGTVNGRQTTPTDRHSCRKANQRCCRHTMEVVFKEIKGFEFIIQPKVFDAGYCHGRCPPRFNPAHHHAMLQSLIWKQSRERAPRPCCAPSKLVELEVLHLDEKDSEKLKISTWTDMRVVECACS